MGSQKANDLLAALLIAGFGIFVIYQASALPYSSEYGPGPGFFPLWLGLGLVGLALLLGAKSALSRVQFEARDVSWKKTGRPLLAWTGLVITFFLIKLLGFLVTFALLTAFLVFVMDQRPFQAAVAVAVGTALVFYLVFTLLLGVPLPVGPWKF